MLVSIIIPTYNRRNYLAATLESVKKQTYQNWECIVVDDGSNDGTEVLMYQYQEKDSRFIYLKRPPNMSKGAAACRNYGFENSTGHYIQYLDSDDLLHPSKIDFQLNIGITDDHVLLTGKWGGFRNIEDTKSMVKFKYNLYRDFKKPSNLLETMGIFNEYFPLHVYLLPRKLVEKAGPWNEDLSNNDDAEFFSRVISHSREIRFCKDSIAYYRYNSSNKLSNLDTEEKILSAIKSWQLISENLSGLREGNAYIKNAKFLLGKQVKKFYPEIFRKYKPFFRGGSDYSKKYRLYLRKFGFPV